MYIYKKSEKNTLFSLNWMMLFTIGLLFVLSIFPHQAKAVSIVLDGTSTLDSGSECSQNAVYRFGTSTSYNGKQLDLLVKILDATYLKKSRCITYENAAIAFKFGSASKSQIFADMQISFVEKGTSDKIQLNSVTGIFKDLDRWLTDDTDTVYLKDHENVALDSSSEVAYAANEELKSTIGVEYEGKLVGGNLQCDDNNAAQVPLCKGIAVWKSTSTINFRLDTTSALIRHYFLSFNLEDAADISLGNDHGDAPISFGDAYHSISSLVSIGPGTTPDSEATAAYSNNADGDDIDNIASADYDDDNGVSSFPLLANGYTNYQLDINATNNSTLPATLVGWIDFNQNGFFESSEASTITVPIESNGALFTLAWTITSNIPDGTIFARFRISTDSSLNASTATGYLLDGEVEDYNLTAAIAKPFACNSDSYVFISDAADSPTFANIIDLANSDSKSANSGLPFHPTNINATGYNLKDGYIWGYDVGNDKVVRVGSDFKVETYNVARLPAEQFHIGDVSPEGILYLASRLYTGTEIYKVDVNPLSPGYKTYLGKIDLNPSQHADVLSAEYIADFSLHPFDNHLYFIGWRNLEKGILYKTNINTGLVTEIGDIGIPLSINPNTTWFDIDGFMYFNDANDVYRIDLSDPLSPKPKANLYTQVTIPSYGDAARCSRAPITEHDYDYGDAPDSYGTDDIPGNSSSGADSIGAKHIVNPNLRLGALTPDAESNGTPSSDASADDNTAFNDEDGISSFPALYTNNTSYSIPATNISLSNVTGKNAVLYGFIDFNQDGDFTDPGETSSISIADGATNPPADLSWSSLSGLAAGTTFIRLRISTDTTLTANGGANDGEVEDHTLVISEPAACVDMTGNTNAGISPVKQLNNGEKFFISTNTLSPSAGHLNAYTLGSDGLPDQHLWDAASQMIQQEGITRLYSSNADATKVLFNVLLDDAFETNGLPTVETIKSYTFNPSFGEQSPYLNGRQSGAFLGAISPNSKIRLISSEVDHFRYMNDVNYKNFYNDVIATRSDETGASNPKRVVVSSDDGFVYAFNQSDGDLGWGWMPRSLVKELKAPDSFHKSHFMQGKVDVLDLKNSGGNFATYIAGSYKAGLGQFVLKLSNSSGLDSVIWDTDHVQTNSLNNQAPNFGERAYFSDKNGTTYTSYITTTITGESSLHIRSLTDDLTHHQILLNFETTSSPYIMQDFHKSSAPVKNTLYLGSRDGKIYSSTLLNDNGLLDTSDNIAVNINGAAVADIGVTTALTHIGAASSKTDNSFYLRAQSANRITLYKYLASDNTWLEQWTSYVGGANKRGENNTMVSDIVNIHTLPDDAQISDSAYIIGNSVVLPVTLPPTDNNCYRTAHYYFYKLPNGHLPTKTFFNTGDNTEMSGSVNIGYGQARKLHIANLQGTTKLLGFGLSAQKPDNTTGINTSFYINDPVATGIRSWRELH